MKKNRFVDYLTAVTSLNRIVAEYLDLAWRLKELDKNSEFSNPISVDIENVALFIDQSSCSIKEFRDRLLK